MVLVEPVMSQPEYTVFAVLVQVMEGVIVLPPTTVWAMEKQLSVASVTVV